MRFQAYLDNIEAKTGNKPHDFKVAAQQAGLLAPGTTATQIIDWLARDFELGRGHAMAIFAVFKQNCWIEAAKKSANKT